MMSAEKAAAPTAIAMPESTAELSSRSEPAAYVSASEAASLGTAERTMGTPTANASQQMKPKWRRKRNTHKGFWQDTSRTGRSWGSSVLGAAASI